MRFLFVISFILFHTTSSYAKAEAENTILVFGKKQLFDNPEYNKKLTELELKLVKSYESLNAQKLVLKSKTSPAKSCESLKAAFKEIKICELDKKLKPDQEVLCKRPVIESAHRKLARSVQEILGESEGGCKIAYSEEELAKVEGLTPLWAQEYTGADLLRQRMIDEDIDTSKAKGLIDILDSDSDKHGEKVSNLIAGDKVSSLIPLKEGLKYTTGMQVSEYLDYYEKCSQEKTCAKYVNNSMSWSRQSIAEVVSKLHKEHGTVYVASAGNDYRPVSSIKTGLSKAGSIILVGSHSPEGSYSDFSNYSEEVVVSAPSNHEVLSFDYDGKPYHFGGTSGAAPQVTAALASFELISGMSLDTKTAKTLLRKTALKFKNDPESKYLGAGLLNSFKIGALAFKVKELCKKALHKTKCGIGLLDKEDFYEVNVEKKSAWESFGEAFPGCGKKALPTKQTICYDKKVALEKFRKAAFLSPDKEMWKGLSCAYQKHGYHKNSKYYAKLARGSRFTPDTDPFELRTGELAELLGNEQFTEDLDAAVMNYLGKSGFGLQLAHHRFKSNRPMMAKRLSVDGSNLEYATDEMKNDKDIVEIAIKNNGRSIQYASTSLRGDRDLALLAVKQYGYALRFVSSKLKDDKKIVLDAVRAIGYALEYASPRLRDAENVVLAAVSDSGAALKFASDRLKAKRDVVLAAIKQSGRALEWASEELRGDKEIVLTAVKNGGSIGNASPELRSDDEVVFAALDRFGGELEYAAEKYKNDRRTVLMVIEEYGRALKYASPELKNDKELVMKAIESDPYALEFATEEFRNDKEVVLSAMKLSGFAFQHASEELQNDKDIIIASVKQIGFGNFIMNFPEIVEKFKDDPEFLAKLKTR